MPGGGLPERRQEARAAVFLPKESPALPVPTPPLGLRDRAAGRAWAPRERGASEAGTQPAPSDGAARALEARPPVASTHWAWAHRTARWTFPRAGGSLT